MRRSQDWLRQAELDLAAAGDFSRSGHHEWACFASQQAAEKAVKGLLVARDERPRSPSVVELLRGLEDLPGNILDSGKALDKHYIHPAGAPGDLYTASEAQRAISDAEQIIEHVRRRLSSA